MRINGIKHTPSFNGKITLRTCDCEYTGTYTLDTDKILSFAMTNKTDAPTWITYKTRPGYSVVDRRNYNTITGLGTTVDIFKLLNVYNIVKNSDITVDLSKYSTPKENQNVSKA